MADQGHREPQGLAREHMDIHTPERNQNNSTQSEPRATRDQQTPTQPQETNRRHTINSPNAINIIDAAIIENTHNLHSTQIQHQESPEPTNPTQTYNTIPTPTHTQANTVTTNQTNRHFTGTDTFLATNTRNTRLIQNLIDLGALPSDRNEYEDPHIYSTQSIHPTNNQNTTHLNHTPNPNSTYWNQPAMAMRTIQTWNIKYSGNTNENIHEFLQNLRDYQTGYEIHDTQLINNLSPILEGDAKNWYRLNRGKWRTLEEFERDITHAFQDIQHRDRLEQKIKNYVQGPTQKITQFLIQFRTLLSQLKPPYHPQTQLDLAYRNMKIEYKTYIKPYDFTNFDQLEIAAKEWEANIEWENTRQTILNNYTHPQETYTHQTYHTQYIPYKYAQTQPRPAILPTPNIPPALTDNIRRNQTNQNTQQTRYPAITYNSPHYTQQQTQTNPNTGTTPRRCFNCNQPGHLRWQCTQVQNQGNE